MSGLGRLNERLVQDRYFDRSDGLQNAEFNYQAATTLGDSLLLFGGLSGYDGIYPARWPRDTSPRPQVAAVARYTFANRETRFSLDSPDELQFFRGRERISLYLRLPHERARRGRFEYRINEGPWNAARGGIIAGLTGTQEGLHQLDLRFLPLGQLDSDRFRRIKFRVSLPWHQSQRFRLLLLTLLLVLLLLLLWQAYRLARRERRVRREVAMDLHDEVGTLLTRARFLLRRQERQESLLANTLAEAGQSLKLYVSTLQSGPRNFPQLVAYLEDFLFGFFQGSPLEFELFATQRPSLPLAQKVFRDIIMVVREAASNTQKHAQAAVFYLALRVEEGYIYLDIWDDGQFQAHSATAGQGGHGLANIRRRAQRTGGYCDQCTTASGALYLALRFKASGA
jgi:signal transduction histidine kinase